MSSTETQPGFLRYAIPVVLVNLVSLLLVDSVSKPFGLALILVAFAVNLTAMHLAYRRAWRTEP